MMRVLCALAFLGGFVRGYIRAVIVYKRCDPAIFLPIGFLIGHFIGPIW